MSMPPRLYKYESFTAQTLQNLKGQVLFFGSPLNFNDPYDCALTPNFETLSDEDVEEIRAYFIASDMPPLMEKQLLALSTAGFRDMLLRGGPKSVSEHIDEFVSSRGIACFSELNDDLLMWSHYGGKYKGLCLEFDTSVAPLTTAKQVRYVPNQPKMSLKAIHLDNNFKVAEALFCTKSNSWRYEREWRIFHETAGTKYVYPAEALTGIYFGPDIDQQSMEIVCLVLQGQNPGVKLWRGTRSTSEFKVLFEEFSYMSHLDAMKRGWISKEK